MKQPLLPELRTPPRPSETPKSFIQRRSFSVDSKTSQSPVTSCTTSDDHVLVLDHDEDISEAVLKDFETALTSTSLTSSTTSKLEVVGVGNVLASKTSSRATTPKTISRDQCYKSAFNCYEESVKQQLHNFDEGFG